MVKVNKDVYVASDILLQINQNYSTEFLNESISMDDFNRPILTDNLNQDQKRSELLNENNYTDTQMFIVENSIKLFQCGICLKKFTQHSNLWKHSLIHTGERPYHCVTCDKTFTQQANLTKHVMIHTGEKPFECKMCGKLFSQQANLKKHIYLHTGEKRYCCIYCGKSFTQQVNLYRHEKTHNKRTRYAYQKYRDEFHQYCSRNYKLYHTNDKLMNENNDNVDYINVFPSSVDSILDLNITQEKETNSINHILELNKDIEKETKLVDYVLDKNKNFGSECIVKEKNHLKTTGVPVLLSTKNGIILKRI